MAKASNRHKLNHSTARTLAALLGTIPLSLGAGLALTLLLPLAGNQRYLVGSFAVFPLWLAACLFVFLAPSGKRAWFGVVSALALVAVLVVLGRIAGRGLALGGGP